MKCAGVHWLVGYGGGHCARKRTGMLGERANGRRHRWDVVVVVSLSDGAEGC